MASRLVRDAAKPFHNIYRQLKAQGEKGGGCLHSIFKVRVNNRFAQGLKQRRITLCKKKFLGVLKAGATPGIAPLLVIQKSMTERVRAANTES